MRSKADAEDAKRRKVVQARSGAGAAGDAWRALMLPIAPQSSEPSRRF